MAYALIKTDDLVQAMIRNAPQGARVEAHHRRGVSRVIVRDTNTEIMLPDGSTIMPQITLRNSELTHKTRGRRKPSEALAHLNDRLLDVMEGAYDKANAALSAPVVPKLRSVAG